MNFSNRQIEIIEAATKLIGAKGIQNLTTKNLAAEIGFSEPALYRHFKGKTEILESVLIFYKEQLGNGLKGIINSEALGIQKIKKMVEFQFNHFTKFPAVIMVIFAETSFQYESVLCEKVSEIMSQKQAMVSSIVELGQKEGNIRTDINANQLTTMVMGMMRITVLRWRLSNFDFNLIDEGKTLCNTIGLLMQKS